MRTRAASEIDGGAPGPSCTDVSDLLRLLISHAAENPIYDDGCGDGGEEIILDVGCDGDRYLLVRMPRAQRKSFVLSPREQEIARMVGLGHPNKVIADVLNISSWTVCTHLRRIFHKLGVSSRAAMVARLLEREGFSRHAILAVWPQTNVQNPPQR
ncbi:MAG: helix-turn-helix transcriptional regulator [Acidobacteriia bacterium]|nr:helix-turn-helix transcriptional regulator [Terriglobia bacterium]